jgi:hypothetical protein
MEGLDFHTPTTDVLRERCVFDRHPFQPYHGHAIYVRDLAALDQEELADAYASDNPGKLACVGELIGLPDCATKVLNRFRPLAEKMTYRQYGWKFEFMPSARVPQQVGAVSEGGRLARRVAQRIER